MDHQWSEALQGVVGLFDGAGGALFDLDHDSGQISRWIGHKLDDGEDEYIAHMNSINPRMAYSLAKPAGHLVWDYRVMSERAMNRNEFYNWAEKSTDVRYFVGSRLLDNNGLSTFTSVEFTRSQGHVTEEKIDLYRLLSRHIANAWQLNIRNKQDRVDRDFHAFVADRSKRGIFTLDRKGNILSLNLRARKILALNDGLAIRDGALVALRASENRKMQLNIASSLRTCRGDDIAAGGVLSLPRPSGRHPYIVQIIPYVHARRPVPDNMPGVVVFVTDPEQMYESDVSILAQLFKLTPREALLADTLSTGRSLMEAAEQMQISYNTARTHLRNIFHKTDTHSQRELLRLLSQF